MCALFATLRPPWITAHPSTRSPSRARATSLWRHRAMQAAWSKVSVVQTRGRRPKQEDVGLLLQVATQSDPVLLAGERSLPAMLADCTWGFAPPTLAHLDSRAGVCDGHGGVEAAMYAADQLTRGLLGMIRDREGDICRSDPQQLQGDLERTFLKASPLGCVHFLRPGLPGSLLRSTRFQSEQVDEALIEHLRHNEALHAGSTATVAMVAGDRSARRLVVSLSADPVGITGGWSSQTDPPSAACRWPTWATRRRSSAAAGRQCR